MNTHEIDQNTIYLMMRGSQAYGTNTPESDIDYGGICLPTKDVFFGIDKFESEENWKDENGNKVDKVIYSFGKAIDLLTANNPNVLDYLCTPDSAILKSSDIWDMVKDNTDLFISKVAKKSFLGYAQAQLGRIETHRQYLLKPPVKPDRDSYGLPPEPIFPTSQYEVIASLSSEFVAEENRDSFYSEMSYLLDTDGAFIVKKHVGIQNYKMAIEMFKVRQQQFLGMMASLNGKFLSPEYEGIARRELKYICDVNNFKSYQKWDKERNEKRKELEIKCGFDAKHGMHLLRLTRMAAEIAENKGVNVCRTGIDADELIDIRLGNQSYEIVMQKADEAKKRAEAAYSTCQLPEYPDKEKILELKRKVLGDWAKKLFF